MSEQNDAPSTPDLDPAGSAEVDADIADLSYEEARDELVAIVAKLEAGSADLEESMHLWGRGERLAAHCQQWLDSAEKKLDAAAGDEDA